MMKYRARNALAVGSILILFLLWRLDYFDSHFPTAIAPPASIRPDPGSVPSSGDAAVQDAPHNASLCAQLPSDGIQLIVKTGASEAFGKVPTQLQTILRCAPDTLIFSDRPQTIGGVALLDSLDTVLPSVKNTSDFDLYHAQKACRGSQADCTRHRDTGKEGWNMDKYKNIHIAEKAYKMRPGRDWYVVIDADTYLFWSTLVLFLARLDPHRKLLIGSIAWYKDVPFAHGGSGYIVSRGAMDEFVGKNPGIGNTYDPIVTDECCGDWMFSKAMMDTSQIPVTQGFPTINGDKVWSMPFGPTHWCEPLATMHHVDSEEMSIFWDFESRHYQKVETRRPLQPILLRDMYQEYFVPLMIDSLDNWDNLAADKVYDNRTEPEKGWNPLSTGRDRQWETQAFASAAQCRTACEKTKECFQYTFHHDGRCGLGKAFRIGYPLNPNESDQAKRQTSGWLTGRIKAWAEAQGACDKVLWPKV